MKISELKIGTGKVNITAKVVSKEEPRDINTKFGATRVANAVIEDDSGSVKLVLWGDDCDKAAEGDNIKIENGFVKEWQGEMQLTVGKFGKMTVL